MAEQEKTELATPKRRKEAREKGQVVKSQELVAAVSLTTAVAVLAATSHSMAERAFTIFSSSLSRPFLVQTDVASMTSSFSHLVYSILGMLATLFCALIATALAAHILQTGFLFLPKKAAPDFSRVNPIKNIQSLFSLGTLARLGYNLLKLLVYAGLVTLAIRRDAETLGSLSNGTPLQIVMFLSRFITRLAFQLCAVSVIFAVGDYCVRRWKYNKDLMMTRQEVLDELKEESGSPQMKGRRKEARRTLLDSIGRVDAPSAARPIARFQTTKERSASPSPNEKDQEGGK